MERTKDIKEEENWLDSGSPFWSTNDHRRNIYTCNEWHSQGKKYEKKGHR